MSKSNTKDFPSRVILIAALSALAVAGCKHTDPGTRVAGWTLIDPAQRHPILVSQEPSILPIQVARGTSGLSPRQRAQIINFYAHYRAKGADGGRIILRAPSGSPNEMAALQVAQEVRTLLEMEGAAGSDIHVEAYHNESDPQPPIRLSYMRYVAEAPECGVWPTNLASEPGNLPYPNLGCATQRNFAAQIANASDLLHPRGTSGRSSERRDTVWNKYIKGESTAAKKSRDERVKVKKSN
ncbi:MAG: CpaD family pilus assembly protein [Filomicrobium sp.]